MRNVPPKNREKNAKAQYLYTSLLLRITSKSLLVQIYSLYHHAINLRLLVNVSRQPSQRPV